MNIKKLPCWAKIALVVGLTVFILNWPASSSEWAAWLQAFGTIAAIGAAIWVSHNQNRHSIQRLHTQKMLNLQDRNDEALVDLMSCIKLMERLGRVVDDLLWTLGRQFDVYEALEQPIDDKDKHSSLRIKRHSYELKVENLNVSLKDFSSGFSALYGIQKNKADFLLNALAKIELHKAPYSAIAMEVSQVIASYQEYAHHCEGILSLVNSTQTAHISNTVEITIPKARLESLIRSFDMMDWFNNMAIDKYDFMDEKLDARVNGLIELGKTI